MRLSWAAGVWQVPYLLPKFGFPLLRQPGWVDLTDEELETKAAPFKIAARKHWASLKTSATLDEQQRLAIEQKRSLQKLKWDDRFLFMAQDLCMRDVLRLNRAVTWLAVMAFVRITCSRSGAFARDWADRLEKRRVWIGRNVMSVEDFVWHREFLELLEDDEALLEALHGEVSLHRVKCHYFEKRYDYPKSATPDVLEVARRANSWMAVYDWQRALYAVQYDGMSYEEIQRALAARAAGYSGGMPLGAKITSDAAASRWLNGERAYLHVQGRTLEEPSLSLRREPMFVELDRESRFTLKEMTVETVGDIFREIGDEIGAKPGASGVVGPVVSVRVAPRSQRCVLVLDRAQRGARPRETRHGLHL